MNEGVNIINVIVYYPNERFINSIKEIYSTLALDYKLFATYDVDQLNKLIDSKDKSIVFIPKEFKLSRTVSKVVSLSEERESGGLYLYQPGINFLKSVSDYTENDSEKNIINILIPSGFNNDLKIIGNITSRLSSEGKRSLIVDTNPCRDMKVSNWDYISKEILNGKLGLADMPYIDDEKCHYLKPFNSIKDYYSNCIVYGKLLESLRDIDGIDYIFFVHYLNDYNVASDIEKYSKVNIIMSYGDSCDIRLKESELNNRYSRKFLELLDINTVNQSVEICSSDNLWNSSKKHYREFELYIYEEVNRC